MTTALVQQWQQLTTTINFHLTATTLMAATTIVGATKYVHMCVKESLCVFAICWGYEGGIKLSLSLSPLNDEQWSWPSFERQPCSL